MGVLGMTGVVWVSSEGGGEGGGGAQNNKTRNSKFYDFRIIGY